MQQLIDERKLSEMTGRSLQTLRNERCLGRGLPYFKIGRSVRYSIDDLEHFLNSHRIETERSKGMR